MTRLAPEQPLAPIGRRFPPGPLLRRPEELADPLCQQETMLRVVGARVAFANYTQLQHDFPQLRDAELLHGRPELEQLSPVRREAAIRQIIDDWMLHNAAVVSVSQARQTVTNTTIPTTGHSVTGYRPPRYGRAAVIPVSPDETAASGQPGGLVDIKGCGVAPNCTPQLRTHADGLFYLGRIFVDLAFQWLFDEIFRRAKPSFWTVPVYGIIDLGFDVKFRDGSGAAPAGLQVRRAHRRPLHGRELPLPGSPLEQLKFEIEMLLRRYGVTSANPGTCFDFEECDGSLRVRYGGTELPMLTPEQRRAIPDLADRLPGTRRFAGVNVQLTREACFDPSAAQLVDFGPYVVAEHFADPVLSLVYGRPLLWSKAVQPDAPHFVQPNPRLRLPFDSWGALGSWPDVEPLETRPRELASRVRVLGYRWARRFRSGELSAAELLTELEAVVAQAIAHWPDHPAAARPS